MTSSSSLLETISDVRFFCSQPCRMFSAKASISPVKMKSFISAAEAFSFSIASRVLLSPEVVPSICLEMMFFVSSNCIFAELLLCPP